MEAARPRKRRKLSTPLRRGTIPEAEENGSPRPSRIRQTCKRLATCDASEEGSAADPVHARYEEWSLQDAVLKRVTDERRTTVFQVQFSYDPCPQQHRKAHLKERVETRGHGARARKPRVRGSIFTAEEDELLVNLKGKGLTWHEIHSRFSNEFPGRSKGTLQVRFFTRLKERERAGRR